MKKLILAATAIVSAATLTTAAHAADIAPAAYDWSGFYFGLNAGAAWNNSEVDHDFEYDGLLVLPPEALDAVDDFGDNLTSDDAVFTGGAMIGYNWQHDSLNRTRILGQ